MARKSTIKLLLINESDNEGERLISLFRNAGRVARSHRATSAEDLHTKLDKGHWDLIIANDKHPEIHIEQCLTQIKKRHPDLPVIVIRDKDVQSVLDAGACDVISTQDDKRLVFAAFRELSHQEKHRKLEQLTAKLKETEERCELLMAQSQEAIAYIADGMLISANPLFCTRFGYDNPDDLDCVPVIDLIADADQDKAKNLLKAQAANTNDSNSTNFVFTGIKQSEETFSAKMQLSNAIVDEEPCIQLCIRDETAPATNSGSPSNELDVATGLYSHDYFLDQLRNTMQQAAAGTTTGILLFISIDNFINLRSKLGLIQADNIIKDVARFIKEKSTKANSLAHFCDDSFTLILPNAKLEKTQAFAQALCQKLEEHIIEIEGQSIQCTASIGLAAIDSQNKDDPSVLIQHAFSACEKLRIDNNNNGIGNGALAFEPTRGITAMGNAQGDEDLDHTLEEALEDGRFELIYQPVVSLRGTNGDHYEVQTVLINDDGKQVPAETFLKTLSFTTPNTRLDRWAIIEATKQLAIQQNTRQDTRLFINLTSNALQDEELVPWLTFALKAGGIKPQSLIFQFPELTITEGLKPAKVFAESIQKLGCQLSISYFGKVNDPYKTLKQVGANFAKISSDFTQELQDGGDTQLLKAMVNSITEYKTQAIIGSIENASALAVLWQLGVDYIQGDYLAAPTREMDYEFTDIA